MKFKTQNAETGMVIDIFASREEAEKAIEKYEAEDKNEGNFTANFYEIVEE